MLKLANIFDLSQFDEYREDNRREVKKANGGLPISLWDTYSAFANCYGGVIILGIKEEKDGSWKTTGLQNASKLCKDFWDTINNSKKVNITPIEWFCSYVERINCNAFGLKKSNALVSSNFLYHLPSPFW